MLLRKKRFKLTMKFYVVTVTNSLLLMRAIYCDTVREHMEKVMGIYSPPMVTDIQGTLEMDTQ